MDGQVTFEFDKDLLLKVFPNLDGRVKDLIVLHSIIRHNFVRDMVRRRIIGLTRFSGEIIFR